MAENDDPAAAGDDTVVGPAASAPEPAPEPSAGFTSRVWSFRAMVAVALASLVIGGGIGSAIAAVSDDDDGDDQVRIGRFDDRKGRGPGGFPGGRELDERFPGGGMREFREEFREGVDPDELERLKQMRQEMLKEMREQIQEWRKELRDQRPEAPEATPSPSAS